jgi:hypothetical protein
MPPGAPSPVPTGYSGVHANQSHLRSTPVRNCTEVRRNNWHKRHAAATVKPRWERRQAVFLIARGGPTELPRWMSRVQVPSPALKLATEGLAFGCCAFGGGQWAAPRRLRRRLHRRLTPGPHLQSGPLTWERPAVRSLCSGSALEFNSLSWISGNAETDPAVHLIGVIAIG